MTSVPHVLTVRCNWCSKQKAPHRVLQLASGQFICDYCLSWHVHASAVAAGSALPRGCQDCGTQLSALESPGAVETRMYVLRKDGVLQLLCRPCMEQFISKTPNLVKNTRFGAEVIKTS